MTLIDSPTTERRFPTPARRFGYAVAIGINIVVVIVVNNLLTWGLVPFLTEDFNQLLGLVNLSLAATILANVIYMAYDPPWFKSVSQIVTSAISIVVAIRAYQVFPFDFSAYEFGWTGIARTILGIGIAGLAIAIVVELVKLARIAVEAEPC